MTNLSKKPQDFNIFVAGKTGAFKGKIISLQKSISLLFGVNCQIITINHYYQYENIVM